MLNLVQFISFFLMFSSWGEGVVNTPIDYNPPHLPPTVTEETGFINHYFPILREVVSCSESPLSTWKEHLKRIAQLLSSLNSICQSTDLFRLQSWDGIEPNCLLKLSDLKVIARVLFDYDFEVPFINLGCLINNKLCPNHPHPSCLFVNSGSCYSPNSSFPLDWKLNMIRQEFDFSYSPSSRVLFLYCETPCCHVVHQVVALTIVKETDNSFSAHYIDSSGSRSSPIFLFNAVQKIFNTNMSQSFCLQQAFGTLDDLSGVYSLVNAKFVLSSQSLDDFNFLLPGENDETQSLFKTELKNFLVEMTVKVLQQKLVFNLKAFSHLFSQEREETLIVYSEKGGSFERADYLTFQDLIEKEQNKFRVLFNLINPIIRSFTESSPKNAIERCLSLRKIIKQWDSEKSFLPNDENLDSLLFLTADLKSKLDWLNSVEGSTTTLPFVVQSSSSPFSADNPICFDYEELRKKKTLKAVSSFSVWEQDFPIIERFLDLDPWIDLPRRKDLLTTSDYLNDFVIFVRQIIANWAKPSFLFSKSFSPNRMLSVGEETIIAKLICGFSTNQVFNHIPNGNISDCFIKIACPLSWSSSSSKSNNCESYHSRNPRGGFKKTNCFLIGSDGCFNSIEEKKLAFSSEINIRLNAYKSFVQKEQENIKPLVIIGYCYSVCCQTIHQSWVLVVDPFNNQAFYFDPYALRLFVFLEETLRRYFPNIVLRSFAQPQQPHGSLDFSGVLAICGAKVIIDFLHLNSDISFDVLENILSVSFPTSGFRSSVEDYQTQAFFKDHLVVIALKRLFARLLLEAKSYNELLDSWDRKFSQFSQRTKIVDELNWLTNLIAWIKPLCGQILFSPDDLLFKSNLQKNNFAFEKLLEETLQKLQERPLWNN